MFEEHELAEKQAMATEKQLLADHHDADAPEPLSKEEMDVHVESRTIS